MTDRPPHPAFRYAATSAAYVCAYVALDWVSYVHAIPQVAITPWNPPPGLALFLVLRFGLRYIPAIPVATLLADIVVRGMPLLPASVFASLTLAGGQTAMGLLLAGPLAIGGRLASVGDVNRLVAAAAVGPLVTGLAYVGINSASGALPAEQAVDAVMLFWIGDALGIVVTTPLLLEFTERLPGLKPRFDAELTLQVLAVVLALWIIFGVEATDEFKFFYLLFLPLIWIAMRRGVRGAVVASLVIQLGLVTAGDSLEAKGVRVRELQYLMLTLALTALYLGMAVSEREAAQREVAERETVLNRALRMATAGELAATVAHELNQPLSAIGTYVRACALLARDGTSAPLLRETLEKATHEVARAGEVIRRLRDFFRAGTMRREPVAPDALIAAAVEALAARLARHRVAIDVRCPPELPPVEVDRLQMEMVIHNLIGNAVDALAHGNVEGPVILVRVARDVDGMLVCDISDNGPGISADVAGRLFEPFASTRDDGMGLGLAMSRSIVEAHGGTLGVAATSERGTTFRLVLPNEKQGERDQRA